MPSRNFQDFVRMPVLAAASVLLLTLGTQAADAEPRTAFVNVSYVFENFIMVQDVQKRIDDKYRDRKADLDRRGADLFKRNREIEQFTNERRLSEAVFDAVQRLRKDQFVYERELDLLNEQLQSDYRAEMREVLSAIRQAVRDVADQKKFVLVLRSPDADDPVADDTPAAKAGDKKDVDLNKKTFLQLNPPQTLREVLDRFNRNPVFHGSPGADITSAVLQKANEAFLKRTRKEK